MKSVFLKYHLVVFIAAGIALAGFFWLAQVRPAAARYRAVRDNLAAARALSAGLSDRLERLRALELVLERHDSGDLVKLRAMFVRSPEIAGLLPLLGRHARATRTILTTVSLGKTNSSEILPVVLEEINAQAQFRGVGYRELEELLKLLTRSVPLVEVTAFTFDPADASLNLNLRVSMVGDADSATSRIDESLFKMPQFRALAEELQLSIPKSVGRNNPFLPAGNP